MPGRYVGRQQSLYGAVGAPNAPTTQVDVPGAIDALTSGATSLIHATMLRKQTERQIAQSQAELALQREREGREAAFQQTELQDRRTAERHRFLEAGGIPAHTDMTPTPTTANVNMPAAPIARAMQGTPDTTKVDAAGNMTGSMAGASAMGSAPGPTTAPLPASTTTETTVPESYDPMKSERFIQANAVAGARAQVQQENLAKRLAAQQSGREFAAQASQDLAKLRARLAAEKSPTARTMTANVKETAAQKVADGLLDRFAGSASPYDDAYEFLLHDPEAKELRDFGVTARHLTAARAKWTRDATGQAIRLQSGSLGMSPTEATDAVKTTRQLVAGGSKTPAAPAANKSSTPATPAKDDFTDDELADAFTAGKKTDADIRAFVLNQRKTKKPTK